MDEKTLIAEMLRFVRAQEPSYQARCRDLWATMPGAYLKASQAIPGDLVDLSVADQVERVHESE